MFTHAVATKSIVVSGYFASMGLGWATRKSAALQAGPTHGKMVGLAASIILYGYCRVQPIFA